MTLPTKQEQTQKTDLWLPTAAGRGGVAEGWTGSLDSEFGISRGKLFYMEWINKVLPYSTENYFQYLVIPQ